VIEPDSFVLGLGIAPFADSDFFDQLHGFAPGGLADLVKSTLDEPGGHGVAVAAALGLFRVGSSRAQPPADTDGAADCVPVFEAQRGGVSDSAPGCGQSQADRSGLDVGRLLGRPKHDPEG
jgi:hypothetical protein